MNIEPDLELVAVLDSNGCAVCVSDPGKRETQQPLSLHPDLLSGSLPGYYQRQRGKLGLKGVVGDRGEGRVLPVQ